MAISNWVRRNFHSDERQELRKKINSYVCWPTESFWWALHTGEFNKRFWCALPRKEDQKHLQRYFGEWVMKALHAFILLEPSERDAVAHFTVEKMKAQRGQATCQGHTASKKMMFSDTYCLTYSQAHVTVRGCLSWPCCYWKNKISWITPLSQGIWFWFKTPTCVGT